MHSEPTPRRHPWRFVILAAFLLTVSVAKDTDAKGEHMAPVTVHVGKAALTASSTLVGGFNPEVETAIRNGFPKEFVFSIRLYRERAYWPDKFLATRTVKRSVKYNALKKLYHVTSLEAEHLEEKTFESYETMTQWVSTLDRVYVAPRDLLKPGSRYYAKIRAYSRTTKVPVILEYLLFFISFKDVSTRWKYSAPFTLQASSAGRPSADFAPRRIDNHVAALPFADPPEA